MEDEHKEVRAAFREQQVKLTYYMVALSVAALGFCVSKTMGQALCLYQIPIGLAVFSWATSTYFGIQSLELNLSVLWQNHGLFVVAMLKKDHGVVLGKEIQSNENIIRNNLKVLTEKFDSSIGWQKKLFYSGFVFYVIGHLLEMGLKTFY